MYNTHEFTFADESASTYGMFICELDDKKHSDAPFGNKAKIVETRLPYRVTPLHYGVRYHDSPLEFTLIFGSEQTLDRYQVQEISNWLTGYQDYQWLSLEQPDMEHIQFRCLIQELTPVSVGWLPVAFEAKVICDSAYGYSYPWEKVYRTDDKPIAVELYNDSTVREHLRPNLKIEMDSGAQSFIMQNLTTGVFMSFENLPAGGITILVDNENEIVRDQNNEYNLYEYFNFQFFDLVSGDNTLIIGKNCTVTISGRFMYNVGA